MKKVVCLLVSLALCMSVALAEVILDGMTYDELVALKDKINLAMWNSKEWQEVTVPQGLWQIGVDIPAGHWQITACPTASFVDVFYGDTLDENGKISFWCTIWKEEIIHGVDSFGYDKDSKLNSFDIDCKEGFFLSIDNGSVIFTPYAGKPSLGFK